MKISIFHRDDENIDTNSDDDNSVHSCVFKCLSHPQEASASISGAGVFGKMKVG